MQWTFRSRRRRKDGADAALGGIVCQAGVPRAAHGVPRCATPAPPGGSLAGEAERRIASAVPGSSALRQVASALCSHSAECAERRTAERESIAPARVQGEPMAWGDGRDESAGLTFTTERAHFTPGSDDG